jgi:hypothetical protein
MKINIPKVIMQVSLAEYAPELQGSYLHVWVNMPMQMLKTYNDLVTDLQARELESAKRMLEMPAQDTARSPLWKAFDQAAHWVSRKKAEDKTEGVQPAMLAWYANLWSQGPEDTQWTVDELHTLEQADPAFLSWMITRTWQARAEHMEQKKKV